MGYDQWKTASPYDDEPDAIAEAENFIKHYQSINEFQSACNIMQALIDDVEGQESEIKSYKKMLKDLKKQLHLPKS